MMASKFVDTTLGPWSSHPENLRKQRFLLLILGLLPILAVAVICVLVYSGSQQNWQEWWKDTVEQYYLLISALFFSFGFLVTLSILYLASFTIGSKKGKITDRDQLIFPPWLLVVVAFFWLVPYLLSLLPNIPLLDKFGFGQLKDIKIRTVLNMLAICPFLCVLTWILCAKEEELKKNEKLVRRRWLLTAALVCIGTLVCSFFLPAFVPLLAKPAYRLCMWIVLLPFTLILLTLWWFWKKKVVEEKEAETEEKTEEEEKKGELPEQAEYVIKHLPEEGIWYENDGMMQQLKEYSERIPKDASTFPLIALMNGKVPTEDQAELKVPTEDQAEFLNKFSSLYEDTLNTFFEDDKNTNQTLPDIILQGSDGSGRTEALCAAAVYAAVVRGQNVLYIVQDSSYASSLAGKMKVRLHDLLVDSYFTADYLKPNFVDAWLPQQSKEEKGETDEKTSAPLDLPPNILFATPEQVERSFFNNSNIASEEKREALRNILLGYSVIMVDDFFEMPIPQQAHLAFILDKFRLLQASEYILGQFVVATCPLQDPHGINSLAERLFGLAQFNTTRNTVLLRPRQCDPFWCGTLRISPDFAGEQSLEKAARILLDICTKKNYNTLFYSKGISRQDAEELEKDYEKKGTVSVSSRLYQLNEEKMPFDTIFYLSLTSGNAAAALRLSLPDDKAGTPVFFRIALEKEAEQTIMKQFALLPNETAISLRAYHLRSVLPFLPKLTPIQASVWSHFGISLTHPFCLDAEISSMPAGLAVTWYYDYYTEPNRYGKDVIWPYLVLSTDSTISNLGQEVDFNILPSTKDSILRDKRQTDLRGDSLLFVAGEEGKTDSGPASQLADWRDSHGDSIGETDLAHSDQLTMVTADKHFAVGNIKPVDERERDNAARYAMVIEAKPKQGLSHDIPIRRFSWNLPEGGFRIPDVACYPDNGTASFSIRFGEAFTNSVSAEISGLMNTLGHVKSFQMTDASKGRKYAYDAFMSCLVFLPETNCSEEGICKSMSGNWSTEASSGFSSPLTHAFSIALRNRMAGLSYFAMTPVFLIEGRDGSFGRLLLWIQEPYNSGRTVYPLLAGELLTDPNFMTDLLKDIQSILEHDDNYVSLAEIRSLSRMAFTGEDTLSQEDWQDEIKRGLYVIKLLLDADALKQDTDARAERRRKSDEERKKRQEEFIDPETISEEDQKQYQEFASAVTAQLMDFKDVIDVSRFCRDYGWSPEKLLDVYTDFLWNSPEIFFVAKSYHSQWSFDPETGSIITFYITNLRYGIRKEEYIQAKRILDKEMAEAKKLLEGVSDDDVVKKALILHDHIVRICDYDVEAAKNNDASPLARTAYSVLVRHKAVCEGYTMAYRYLLEKCAGIRSEEVISDKMNHCWNYLFLKGKWYHVDVTWDDPVYHGQKPDPTKISHEFFLLSDEKIAAKEHYNWSVRGLPPATDTQFDNKNWKSC